MAAGSGETLWENDGGPAADVLPGTLAAGPKRLYFHDDAAVVALDSQERVCLLRQYRHAAGGWLWELPAGKLEPGEAAQLTAQRELEEEAGLQAVEWRRLGETLTTPGFCDEVIHLFLARQLSRVPARPQTHELIEVHWLPLGTAVAQVHSGEIRDAKTMLGLLLAAGC